MNVKKTAGSLIFAVLNILVSLRVVLEQTVKAQRGSTGIALPLALGGSGWSKFVEKIITHNLFSINFFRQSYRLWDNVKKCGTARQATDYNIIRRVCTVYWVTKAMETQNICNYCSSTAKMVTRTRTHVTFIQTLPALFRKRIAVDCERHFGSSNTLAVKMRPFNFRAYGKCSYHKAAQG
jgi:hypothetical protein